MTKKNTEGDNWGQLLSEFGIEDTVQEETTEPEQLEVEEPAKAVAQPEVSVKLNGSHDFGAGLVDSEEATDHASNPREKKSIFSRFPKINFFGAPPEVSLDSVIEGVKSPSLGGKAFTDNKLEKMPLSQEWADRQEKNVAAGSRGALSAVASQIDTLASDRNRSKSKEVNTEERPAKRHASSMFDDPIPESDEFRALKNIMGEPSRRDETHRDAFLEDKPDTWKRERGRSGPKSPAKENEGRGRGSRYRPPIEQDDLPSTDFEPVDDEMPRTRGRRGSRYSGESYRNVEQIQDDVPQEEWSEVDAALQASHGEPVQRGGRRPRHDKRRRPERTESSAFSREPSDIEEGSGVVAVHGNIPSWDEAVGDIISSNITKHKSHSHAGRGRR